MKRKVKKNDSEIMSRNHSKVVKSWSTTHYLVEELDNIAKKIKKASGVHCDRSKILNALVDVLIEHQSNLHFEGVVDHRSLKDELEAMLKKR
jgi:NTP pyrophosphatase (non-canonical NTP hydrolase)